MSDDLGVERAYVPRLADHAIDLLLGQLPAVLVVGPRATGKTTTARRYVRTFVRLDRPAEAVAFRADPDAALRGLEEPVLLDEWQVVPEVLGAVKRAVDDDPRPGRFLITGSVRGDLDAATWPGTGRLVRVTMFGITEREFRGDRLTQSFLDRVDEHGPAALQAPRDPPDLRGYVELALRSGYPEPALRLGPQTRPVWMDSYIEQLLTRDAEQVENGGRDPERLRRYFQAVALNTAGVVADRTLYEAAGLNRRTAVAYEQLLKNLFVLEWLPSWSSNRLKRLVRAPKRHLVDPALAAAALRLDTNAVLRDGDVLGRMIDGFVTAQIRAEAATSLARQRLYHVRSDQGRHEIDLLIEMSARRVVAIEVKADAAPGLDAAKHLRWLEDELGEQFALGIVFHTGPRRYQLAERIVAAPVAAIWA